MGAGKIPAPAARAEHPPGLATLFDDNHVDDTCDKLAGSGERDAAADKREADIRKQIADCDRRLERYRNVVDEGGDVATVAKWVEEVERERKTLTAQLG